MLTGLGSPLLEMSIVEWYALDGCKVDSELITCK